MSYEALYARNIYVMQLSHMGRVLDVEFSQGKIVSVDDVVVDGSNDDCGPLNIVD